MKTAQKGFLIGKVAERTGTSVSALRFYEDKGLIQSSRTSGGKRVFAASEIRRVSFIIIAQKLGFSLAEIKSRLDELPGGRVPTKSDWEAIATSFRVEIDARIAGLEILRDRLSGCIGCGCLSLEVCRIYNPDDNAARNGSGPRYLMGDRPKITKT